MKNKEELCIACEISGKEVQATHIIDNCPLCKKHAAVYSGKFETIIHEGDKKCKSKETE